MVIIAQTEGSLIVSIVALILTMVGLVFTGISNRRSALGRRVDDMKADIIELRDKVNQCEKDRGELREDNFKLMTRLLDLEKKA